MHVISKRPFVYAAEKYPAQRSTLLDLYKILSKVRFNSPEAMRRVFPTLDNFKYEDKWWVIDVGGNHLRVIAFIQFQQNRIYIKHIVTHARYDSLCKKYRQ